MLASLFEEFNIKSTSLFLKKGDIAFRFGDTTQSIYRVITGQIQLFREDLNANRIILHQAFSGQFFAEASINSDRYHCTAQSVVDTELQVINLEYFRHLLKKDNAFSNAWINHLSTELRRQRASTERLNLKTAVEKITHYILTEGNTQGEIHIKVPLTEVAQIIGLSRESLYRTLSKMKKENRLVKTSFGLKLLF